MSLERKKIDDLAAQAGGYFSLPTEDSKAYTDLLFDLSAVWHPLLYSDKEGALFRRGSDPCHLGKTTGRKDRYPPKYPACVLCLNHLFFDYYLTTAAVKQV